MSTAQKHTDFKGAIFTQATNRMIQTLDDSKGQSFAWGHTNSTTGSQLARFFLAENGFHARDFSNFATNYLENHAAVTNAVAQGTFAIGAAKQSYARNVNFRILGTYPNIGMVWVARPNLDLKAQETIRYSLISVDSRLVKDLEDSVTGFEQKADAAYDGLRLKMNKAKGFD